MRIYTKATTMAEFMNIVDKVCETLEEPTTIGDALDEFDNIVSEFFGTHIYEGRNLSVDLYNRTNRYNIRIDVAVNVSATDEDKEHTLIMTYELWLKHDTLELDALEYRETKHYSADRCKWAEFTMDFDDNTFCIKEYEQNDEQLD